MTFNRCDLLKQCLSAIVGQTRKPDRVLIIDNASTDGTSTWLLNWLPQQLPDARVIRLERNTGGAGGFSSGLRTAIDDGADWVWMMDDDASPEPDALAALVREQRNPYAIYGSLATPNGQDLSWPLFSVSGEGFNRIAEVPDKVLVASLPFLGILIPCAIPNTIGYPDAEYFIAGDDTEYCLRASAIHVPIYAIGASRIRHPTSQYYQFGIGKFAPICFCIAPWKRYYDVRNRILTNRRYGWFHILTRTIPATALRLLATLLNEPRRWHQLKAYLVGTLDGLRGKKGKRHHLWRI